MKCSRIVIALPFMLALAGSASAQQDKPMSEIVYETVMALSKSKADGGRAGGGYDLHKRFTQNLSYGRPTDPGAGILTSSTPGGPWPSRTMCVAAVAEVLVESLNRWGASHDFRFTQQLPISRWTNGTRTGVIANVFMYKEAGSRGTAFALKRLGMGREKPFPDLVRGDFINFNRSGGSGHAVVFLGFLKNGSVTSQASFPGANLAGFRYFSAQGQRRPDGGFGFRNAYFAGKCPAPRGRNDDCNIVGLQVRPDGSVNQNTLYLNTGELFAPPQWRVAEALAELRRDVSRGFEDDPMYRDTGAREAAISAVLNQRLDPDEARFIDGSDDR